MLPAVPADIMPMLRGTNRAMRDMVDGAGAGPAWHRSTHALLPPDKQDEPCTALQIQHKLRVHAAARVRMRLAQPALQSTLSVPAEEFSQAVWGPIGTAAADLVLVGARAPGTPTPGPPRWSRCGNMCYLQDLNTLGVCLVEVDAAWPMYGISNHLQWRDWGPEYADLVTMGDTQPIFVRASQGRRVCTASSRMCMVNSPFWPDANGRYFSNVDPDVG
ncbi:hypothetical protein WJX84_008963 [Apatococcus fuscideae]|uniref:Uncharacterized protein n=1 Tax=Apatococcus fuscideae TaxID=2026836 RepID=A0AAW1SI27_9CHLO